MKTLIHTLVTTVAFAAIAHAQPPPPGPSGPPPRDNRQPAAQTGSAIVRGRVVAADTGRPLRRARVTLAAPELGRDGRTTSTDLDGSYEVTDLPAGRYIIRVARSGYLGLQYGQRRPLEQGKPLQVADRQVVEHVDFTLPRTSVIREQIGDELNGPVAGVNVIAMRMAYWQGRRRLVPVGAPAQTDEGGEYRLTNLSPGTYFVMAQLRDTWTVRGNGTTQAMGRQNVDPHVHVGHAASVGGATARRHRIGSLGTSGGSGRGMRTCAGRSGARATGRWNRRRPGLAPRAHHASGQRVHTASRYAGGRDRRALDALGVSRRRAARRRMSQRAGEAKGRTGARMRWRVLRAGAAPSSRHTLRRYSVRSAINGSTPVARLARM